MYLKAFSLPGKAGFTKMLLIMRITAIILLGSCMQVCARGYPQTISLSEKNASLEKIFRDVKRQTGYDFWYETRLVKHARKMDLDIRNVPHVIDGLPMHQRELVKRHGGNLFDGKRRTYAAGVGQRFSEHGSHRRNTRR